MVGRKAETEDFATASLCVSLTSASVGGNTYELLGMRMEPHFCLQPKLKLVQALENQFRLWMQPMKIAWYLLMVNKCPDKH